MIDKKNIKISSKHHEILKDYCDKNGLKVYRTLEKLIDELCKNEKKPLIIEKKGKDIYGD